MPQAQTQSDPWVEAAKNFKGAPQGVAASAATGGGEDWKVWQQGDEAGVGQEGGLRRAFDQAEQTEPVDTSGIGGFAKSIAHNLGAGTTRLFDPRALAKIPGQIMGLTNPGYNPGAEDIVRGFMNNPSGESVAAIPSAVLGAVGGERVASARPSGNSLLGGYKSAVVPAAESASENLAKAILPPEGVTPNLVKAIQREAPAVREYAGRTSNPLKTVPEGMKAAEGVAQEGLQHYRTNFLEPNAQNQVILGGDSPTLGHVSTLGEVEKRISDINDLTRGAATRAKSAGAEMTAQERLGLENEGKALRQKLYSGLSEKTGVPPEDIQGMREGYGGQFALKNALEGGHMQRLTRVGLESQGAGTGIYPSKAGIIDKAMTALRGGPERIANRQFAKRINAFEPEAVTRPMPVRLPQAPFEPSTPISESMARQVNAVEPAGATGVQPQPVAAPRTNGPIAKAPTILENEKASQDFQDQQNAAARMKKEANRASAGKRLQGGQ